jgi:hypothetical protein
VTIILSVIARLLPLYVAAEMFLLSACAGKHASSITVFHDSVRALEKRNAYKILIGNIKEIDH